MFESPTNPWLRRAGLSVVFLMLALSTTVAAAVEPPAAVTPVSEAPVSSADETIPDPGLLAEIEGAKPLHEQREGISLQEPEYCSQSLEREINPSASNGASIQVGPPKFLVSGLEDAPTWWHCISILNRYPKSRTVQLSTLDVVGSLDPNVTLETRDEPAGVGAWIEPVVDRVVLAPGERVLVPYLLRVPQQPPVGSSVGGIRVTDVTDSELEGGGALITKSLIVQLQATFPGGEARELSIRSVDSTRLVWTNRDPEVVIAKFIAANEGTVIDTMTPTLEVDGLFGRRVATVKGVPEVMVPQSAQRQTLRWRPIPFIGVYSPTLKISSEAGEQVIELPRVYIIPPLPYLVAVGVALALLVYGLVRRRSRRGWRAYLDEELDGDEFDDDEFPGEYGDHEPR